MIQVQNLSKRFGGALAVDGLDFTVAQGEIVGFLGPNGAGKTTTMRILTGYFPPSGGEAKVAGHDVLNDPLAARAAMGYLPESVPLYKDMRVGEYLRFVGRAKGLGRAQAKKEAGRVMALTGISGRAGQLIKQLSKGYRQRVGMAQALVGDPPVLILDEPTIGLDPTQIVQVRSLIKSFAGQKTVVLSSHILPEVAATCTRILIISQGKLVAQGPPEMLTGQAGAKDLRLACLGDRDAVAAALDQTGAVESWRPAPGPAPEGVSLLDLRTSGELAARAAISRALAQAGLGLVELRPLGHSLEDVFMRLTTEEPAPQEVRS